MTAPGLDPRGVRFNAALSTIVLAVVVVTGWAWLALAQAAVFAITAAAPARGPYSLVYRALVAPRVGPPAEREHPAPVRFAQLVGLGFVAAAGFSYLAGAAVAGTVLAAAALAAAFLNAAFGLCLGCEFYLAVRRMAGRPVAPIR